MSKSKYAKYLSSYDVFNVSDSPIDFNNYLHKYNVLTGWQEPYKYDYSQISDVINLIYLLRLHSINKFESKFKNIIVEEFYKYVVSSNNWSLGVDHKYLSTDDIPKFYQIVFGYMDSRYYKDQKSFNNTFSEEFRIIYDVNNFFTSSNRHNHNMSDKFSNDFDNTIYSLYRRGLISNKFKESIFEFKDCGNISNFKNSSRFYSEYDHVKTVSGHIQLTDGDIVKGYASRTYNFPYYSPLYMDDFLDQFSFKEIVVFALSLKNDILKNILIRMNMWSEKNDSSTNIELIGLVLVNIVLVRNVFMHPGFSLDFDASSINKHFRINDEIWGKLCKFFNNDDKKYMVDLEKTFQSYNIPKYEYNCIIYRFFNIVFNILYSQYWAEEQDVDSVDTNVYEQLMNVIYLKCDKLKDREINKGVPSLVTLLDEIDLSGSFDKIYLHIKEKYNIKL